MLNGLFKGKTEKSKVRAKDPKPTSAGLEYTKFALKALGNIADSTLIPGLKVLTTTAVQIINATQTIESDKAEMSLIAERTVRLMHTVIESTEGKTSAELDTRLGQKLDLLNEDLETVLDIVQDMASTDKAGLALRLSGRSQQISRCKTMLDAAFQSFQINTSIASHLSITELQASVVKIEQHLSELVLRDKSPLVVSTISFQSSKVLINFGIDAGRWSIERHVRLIADTVGDKQADIVGFGENGVWISINTGNNRFTAPPNMALTDFSYVNGGWRVDKHIRLMADIRSVGRADIVGFGNAGVLIARNNGCGKFGPAELVVPEFGYHRGRWRLDRHLRFLADVTGNGLLDIVGFGEEKVVVSCNNGNGSFQPPKGVLDHFGYKAGGWRVEKHPRFLADLTGDGRADIIGFGDAGMCVSLNNGSGEFGPVTLAIKDFGYKADGWRVEKHPRFLADLTGDGRADVIGFGNKGVCVSLNNGSGAFGPVTLAIHNFGCEAAGWSVERHPRFLACLTGNKRADIVGFGDNGVYVAISNGDGTFQPVRRVIGNFGYKQGWRVDKHPRFVVDLTGDGCADIIGFGQHSTWVSYNSGGNFGPVTKLIDNFAYS